MSEVPRLDPDSPGLGVAITADEETWLPYLVLAIPIEESFVGVAMTSEEALRIGAAMVNLGMEVKNLTEAIQDKSVEERREIIVLEHQLMAPTEE